MECTLIKSEVELDLNEDFTQTCANTANRNLHPLQQCQNCQKQHLTTACVDVEGIRTHAIVDNNGDFITQGTRAGNTPSENNNNNNKNLVDIYPGSQPKFFTFSIPEEDETLECSSLYKNALQCSATSCSVKDKESETSRVTKATTSGRNDAGESDESQEDSDSKIMERLKAITKRLQLRTRRQSIISWQYQSPTLVKDHSQLVERLRELRSQSNGSTGSECSEESTNEAETNSSCSEDLQTESKEDWTERVQNINDSISWLRKELLAMRAQDANLARTLMALREDMQKLRLHKSSMEHRELLEDAISSQEDELSNLCDSPPDQFSPTLKHFGVTRMNLSRRRFSVF